MNIILFGPPGAGKGTQAQSIVKKHNYFQLSTGNLLRDEVKSKTDLGAEIEKLISNGKFVSDEIVNTLLRQSLINLKYRDRIIFDGYPRNVEQANNLEVILKEFKQTIGHTIFLNVSRDIIEKRIMGRMTCEKCNMTLNEYFNKDQIELHPCGVEQHIAICRCCFRPASSHDHFAHRVPLRPKHHNPAIPTVVPVPRH